MKIKELTVNNFKSFKGESKFCFDTDEERNIVLIGGENGSGKTSVFEAIKLCMYGPLTYRYQGFVPNYIARIKSMLNEDVFIYNSISAHIQLTIDIDEGNLYSLRREWEISNGKLSESFIIYKEGERLCDSKKEKVESYLKSKIPLGVFDLFFFNGEELSDFFGQKSIDLKLKESILTLNNLDVFSILSKELLLNARRKDKERENLREYIIEVEALEDNILNIETRLQCAVEEIHRIYGIFDELSVEKKNINDEFIKSGGLNEAEKDRILNSISKSEIERDFLNQEIKEFSNNTLPFIIVKNLLKDVKEQIYKEEDFIAYNIVEDRIDAPKFAEMINRVLDIKDISIAKIGAIAEELKRMIIPQDLSRDFKPIHNLSKEQQNKVVTVIDQVAALGLDEINYFNEISSLTKNIADLKSRLSNSLADEEQERFINKINSLNDRSVEISVKLHKLEDEKRKCEDELSNLYGTLKRLTEKISLIKRADNVKDISNNMINMIDNMLLSITANIKSEIERHFKDIIGTIIRNEKIIDFIKLDNEFRITLYINKAYTNEEITRMIINLGLEEIENRFGTLFIEELKRLCDSSDKRRILIELNKMTSDTKIELNTKLDVMSLSSGEKQVYILCLYWALIKSSGLDIPFIIDTPYGRIDEKHRMSITSKFLPRISHQVVVLSTNTEIEEGLYNDINEFVSKEYMLEYNAKDRRTVVKEGYFYEVE